MTLVERAKAVEAARDEVEGAMRAYSKGGSVDAVNAANRKLADAHQRYYETTGGIVHDDR